MNLGEGPQDGVVSWLPSGLTTDLSNSLQISSQHVSDVRRNYLEYVTIQFHNGFSG
jgi:hypothetical protein